MAGATQYNAQSTERSVVAALLSAKGRFGGAKTAIIDGDERALTYTEITRAAFALGSALRHKTAPGETVGVLLPTGIGPVISFFALHCAGRIPAMLNFTSGGKNLKSACRTAVIKHVVTAHRFVELGNLQGLIAELASDVKFIYLEELREGLSPIDKAMGVAGPFLPWLLGPKIGPNDTAVILFTSGTEGDPKGVAISHKGLLANVEQVRCHIDIFPSDILFNPLPTFHCFGLTVGALMPLYLGIKSIQHPTPLQARAIAKRVRDTGATMLLATDTFLSQYARAGDQGDLNSLRLAVCGAERVRDETRQIVRKKYAIEILEGYGVTEAAPVIAANQPGDNRPGTVGRLMQAMEHRLEPVPGMTEGGRLFVRGPNIMLGYVLPDAPGKIQPPHEGWHDTGDIVTVDEDGVITIRGRLKRFAKIGGEMISLAVVENCASALWPEHMHAALSIPDGRKGEQIVLLSDSPEANRPDLVGWAKNHGVSELAVPRRIYHVAAIPLLGTGKTDYGRAEHLLKEKLALEAAVQPGLSGGKGQVPAA
jgi:acyl-[acyl-carrier-protein]-phospholipid O-acyltransferase/long-chain-fatty-acid--[acyl-carrier-protein] ligase